MTGPSAPPGSDPPPRAPLIELIRNPEASEVIHQTNEAAGVFLGFAFTFYAVQLTVAGANLLTGKPAGPWYYLLPLLLVSDFLTGVFSWAAIARFDFGFEISRIYRPWPTAKETLDQAPTPGDWFPRWWFRLEEAFSRRVPVSDLTGLTRLSGRGLSRPFAKGYDLGVV